jgi:hypothetical protein
LGIFLKELHSEEMLYIVDESDADEIPGNNSADMLASPQQDLGALTVGWNSRNLECSPAAG